MLPEMAIKYITQLCNVVVRGGFFPFLSKVAQIKIIQKPGKPVKLTESYRPINLLSVLSKLFKLLLSRINIIMEDDGLIRDQFGFRNKHAITEQIQRIVKRINNDMEAGKYCSAVFLDILQALDKALAWRTTLQNQK